jgi:hypothetical protein
MSDTSATLPVLTIRERLLAEVVACPHDAALRQVLADCCDDDGDPAEARVQRLAAYVCRGLGRAGLEALYGWPAGTVAAVGDVHTTATPPRGYADAAAHARDLLGWATRHRGALEQVAARVRREADLLGRAAAGDVQALLAHPGSRAAVRRLAAGEKGGRHQKKPTDYCTGRKAVAAAKAVMTARLERRAARRVAEAARTQTPGRIQALWIAKLRERAVEAGELYHRTVKSLYQSKYAYVAYGPGGREEVDRERYSKGWHSSFGPASCRLAGARLDNEVRPTCVILENWRGTEACRLPLR